MATAQGSVSSISSLRSCRSLASSDSSLAFLVRSPESRRRTSRRIAISRRLELGVVAQKAVQGAPPAYAKQMERLSVKESLLVAFKDSGGFEGVVSGKTTDVQRIDVTERIIVLERLNSTSRPTTSPFLEGRWNFEWFGAGTPGLSAAKFIFERFPATWATLSKMDIVIKDGNAKITANMKLLNTIESKLIVSTELSVEGPLRMKEEYIEGILETPKLIEETLPEQLRGALSQAASTMEQFPVAFRDAVACGLTIPLSGTFQRLFMISYLHEEILIIRDTSGLPEVLTRFAQLLDVEVAVTDINTQNLNSLAMEALNSAPTSTTTTTSTSSPPPLAINRASRPISKPKAQDPHHPHLGAEIKTDAANFRELLQRLTGKPSPGGESFPVSCWTSSRKLAASVLMISGAKMWMMWILGLGALRPG